MSEAAVKIPAGMREAHMTRRAFMETSITVASGMVMAAMPVFSGAEAFAVSTAPVTPSEAPVMTFDSYFTGWLVYDFGGNAHPYEPPADRRPAAGLAAMSDEEFHRHFMYL